MSVSRRAGALEFGGERLDIASPMAGKIVEVLCSPSDTVDAGQDLLVLEAMKIHHAITAPSPGIIAELLVALGDPVAEDQIVVRLEP